MHERPRRLRQRYAGLQARPRTDAPQIDVVVESAELAEGTEPVDGNGRTVVETRIVVLHPLTRVEDARPDEQAETRRLPFRRTVAELQVEMLVPQSIGCRGTHEVRSSERRAKVLKALPRNRVVFSEV